MKKNQMNGKEQSKKKELVVLTHYDKLFKAFDEFASTAPRWWGFRRT